MNVRRSRDSSSPRCGRRPTLGPTRSCFYGHGVSRGRATADGLSRREVQTPATWVGAEVSRRRRGGRRAPPVRRSRSSRPRRTSTRRASPLSGRRRICRAIGVCDNRGGYGDPFVGERIGKRRGRVARDRDAGELIRQRARGAHRCRRVAASGAGWQSLCARASRCAPVAAANRNAMSEVASHRQGGAYAIQGEGRRIVESYDGCLANVTGPLCHVYFALRRVGVVPRERPRSYARRTSRSRARVARGAAARARVTRRR